MYFITIDCGTTNSRVYAVDENGKKYAKVAKKVGVRNTSMTGSRACLEEGLRDAVHECIHSSGIQPEEFRAILSSGMITSEIGLCEIPHLMAPCNATQLAESITLVKDVHLTDFNIPVYFVRGIKNAMPETVENPFNLVGNLDFMRGEEVQMVGMMAHSSCVLPATAVVLSSHTKFIAIDANERILGSLTTTSGQIREAILAQTFVGKSVEKRDNPEDEPEEYFDTDIVREAAEWIQRAGIVRSMMFPRFLDVLLDTKWYERKLFFDALIAAEDMLAINQLDTFDKTCKERFILIGLPSRCRLYEYILRQLMPNAQVSSITEPEEIDKLSIDGILNIVKKAGLIK